VVGRKLVEKRERALEVPNGILEGEVGERFVRGASGVRDRLRTFAERRGLGEVLRERGRGALRAGRFFDRAANAGVQSRSLRSSELGVERLTDQVVREGIPSGAFTDGSDEAGELRSVQRVEHVGGTETT